MKLPSTLFCPALLATTLTAPQVNVGNTTITGTVFEPDKVEFFGGLPFAKPPIGDLRFKPAVFLPSPQVPTLNAVRYSPICLQNLMAIKFVSEDCLTLNIFRPAGVSPDAKLPVMFWIYGGGYVIGGSPFNNGSDLVAYSVTRGTPVIFVSFNYRVGPLGFPQGIEAGQRKLLNLGFSDQLVALQWVHENIANFGGDNSKITVFGESAGAGSIVIHLYRTEFAKFARAIILQSYSTVPAFDPERNEAIWQQYVAAIPFCASLANTTNTFDCLQKADTASLLEGLITAGISWRTTSFRPVVDGAGGFLPDRPSKLHYKTHLPALIGSNLDEGSLFAPQNLDSEDAIRDLLRAATSPALDPEVQAAGIEKILQLYQDIPAQGAPFGTGNNTFGLSSHYKRYAAIYGDWIFESSRRFFIEKMNEACIKVYGYLFADSEAPSSPLFAAPAPGSLGVAHSAELTYVFNSFKIFRSMKAPPSTSALTLSRIMQDYWISFVINLDPNDDHGFKRPYWDQYTPIDQTLMELAGLKSKLIPDDFRLEQIAFLRDNPDVFHR